MDYSNYSREDNRHRKCYRKFRRSSNGLIYGVCQGISNYTGVSVGLIRTISVITLIVTGFAPIGIIYLLLAVFVPTVD
jgi:phage shock protein C